MKKIVCRFDLFDMKQKIYCVTEDNAEEIGETTIFDMANDMTFFAALDEYKTNKFHLYGPQQYAEMISQQLKKFALSKYNETNIEVEIN